MINELQSKMRNKCHIFQYKNHFKISLIFNIKREFLIKLDLIIFEEGGGCKFLEKLDAVLSLLEN